MIKKHQLPMSLALKVKSMKEEDAKHVHYGKIIAPSVTRNNEDERKCQRVNRKAIKSWFKTKKRRSD